MLKRSLLGFKRRLDYTEYGGALLLGVNGVCIICHGSSNSRAIYSAIRIAKKTVDADIAGTIRSAMERIAPSKDDNRDGADDVTPPVSF